VRLNTSIVLKHRGRHTQTMNISCEAHSLFPMQASLERLGVLDSQVVSIDELRTRLSGTNVDAQLKRSGEAGLDDLTLTRWLRAQKWDVESAAAGLSQHATLREEISPIGGVDKVHFLSDHAHRVTDSISRVSLAVQRATAPDSRANVRKLAVAQCKHGDLERVSLPVPTCPLAAAALHPKSVCCVVRDSFRTPSARSWRLLHAGR
jgi:hypothetical protein